MKPLRGKRVGPRKPMTGDSAGRADGKQFSGLEQDGVASQRSFAGALSLSVGHRHRLGESEECGQEVGRGKVPTRRSCTFRRWRYSQPVRTDAPPNRGYRRPRQGLAVPSRETWSGISSAVVDPRLTTQGVVCVGWAALVWRSFARRCSRSAASRSVTHPDPSWNTDQGV